MVREAEVIDRPPYRVPSLVEIGMLPPNGYRMVSTFSGCGGSCLGFKMDGFTVLWANEFVPAAQDTYRANHPNTILDTRSIRDVSAEEIMRTLNIERGEIDLLEGSPPCASFSTAGKRDRGWGKVSAYSDRTERTDDLFYEFIRVLDGLQPKTFVAENVSGLVKGTAKGYFKAILAAMRAVGYNVEARLLDSQWLGVPQARQRVIFVGVRNDLEMAPVFPDPLPYRYSVRDACPWITRIQTGSFCSEWRDSDEPMGTITASDGVRNHRSACVAAAPPHPGLPTDAAPLDISPYAVGHDWDNIAVGGRSTRYFQSHKIDPTVPAPTILATGGEPSVASPMHPYEKRKFTIAELRRICSFPDDFILTGNYPQQWERLGRSVPPVMMFHVAHTVRTRILDAQKG